MKLAGSGVIAKRPRSKYCGKCTGIGLPGLWPVSHRGKAPSYLDDDGRLGACSSSHDGV